MNADDLIALGVMLLCCLVQLAACWPARRRSPKRRPSPDEILQMVICRCPEHAIDSSTYTGQGDDGSPFAFAGSCDECSRIADVWARSFRVQQDGKIPGRTNRQPKT